MKRVFYIVIAMTLAAGTAGAATLTWDSTPGDPINDGGGNWLDAGQWNNGSPGATWTSGDNSIIGNGGNGGTITLGAVTAGTVIFTNFTITYTLSGGSLTNSGGISDSPNSGNITIGSQIAGAGGIRKIGPGRLIYSDTGNSYTGPTVVNAGILQIGTGYGNSWANGTLPSGSNLEISNGVVVVFYYGSRSLGSGPGQIQITGGTSGFSVYQYDAAGEIWKINNDLNYEVVWGSPYFKPDVFVMNDGSSGPNCCVNIGNKIDLNGVDRTISCNSTNTGSKDPAVGAGGWFSGVIRNSSGTAGIIKTGPGELRLLAANTFNGPVTVSNGRLIIGGSGSLGSGNYTNSVSIATGAVFSVSTSANQTLGGVIGGGGSLAKSGTGKLTLSATNTYSGYTTISGGTMEISGTGWLGVNGVYTGNITNNGTMVYNSSVTQYLSGAMSGSGPLTVKSGRLVVGASGSAYSGAVTVTNSAGSTVGVGISVTNNTLQFNCASMAFKTNGPGCQLCFMFSVTASKTVAPLNITGDLIFSNAPLVEVDLNSLTTGGNYPLIAVGGTAPSEVPALIGLTGTLYWNSNTLYLFKPASGMVLTVR